MHQSRCSRRDLERYDQLLAVSGSAVKSMEDLPEADPSLTTLSFPKKRSKGLLGLLD